MSHSRVKPDFCERCGCSVYDPAGDDPNESYYCECLQETFQLHNDPSTAKRTRFENGERTRQRVLIDGLDCLPGQQDLF